MSALAQVRRAEDEVLPPIRAEIGWPEDCEPLMQRIKR